MVKAKILKILRIIKKEFSVFINISWTKRYFVRKQKIIFLENANMPSEIKAGRAKKKMRIYLHIY